MALVAEESLNHVFSDLKSKNKETRLRASYELLNHVNIAHRGKRHITTARVELTEVRSSVRQILRLLHACQLTCSPAGGDKH